MLERSEDAKKRNARIEMEIIGYGSAFDPPQSEALLFHGSQHAVQQAMQLAISDAEIEQVDLVLSARSGLRELDEAEQAAIEATLGDSVAVVAPKVILGETFGAAGAFSIAAALGWSRECPLPALIQGQARSTPKTILVNSVGFYGNASTVIVRAT